MTADEDRGLLLPGLDGSNPLAFLAALGTLRTLTLAWPDRRVVMVWHRHAGAWRPSLRTDGQTLTEADVVDTLETALADRARCRGFTLQSEPDESEGKPAPKLRISPDAYRRFARAAARAAAPGARHDADFAAAWACEVCKRKDNVQDTAFQFTAGNQRFLEMVRDLADDTTAEHIQSTLFELWSYEDPTPSMRWDPVDEGRQYALQAHDPAGSKNPIRTVRGANRLAVAGLPLLPSVPVGSDLRTTGFAIRDGANAWTWPIWNASATMPVVRSLLSLPELQAHGDDFDRSELEGMGITEVFRARVVLPSGRYRNFAQARAV